LCWKFFQILRSCCYTCSSCCCSGWYIS
jgi:hypothetical protein